MRGKEKEKDMREEGRRASIEGKKLADGWGPAREGTSRE